MHDGSAESQRIRGLYDKLAPRYDKIMRSWERLCFGASRDWVCSRAEGRVLELAAGTGLNFPHYPAGVRITAMDLSPEMLRLARSRAQELGCAVRLLIADGQNLPFANGRFDSVVIALGLCTIPDEGRAIDEAKRVLPPGGRLLLMEHVRSPNPVVRALQWLLDLFTVRFQADHQLREPLNHVLRAGFVVDELERLRAGWVERLSAHKPA